MTNTDPWFALSGEIDLENARTIRTALFAALESCTDDPVLDCSELTYIDSSGLSVLVQVRDALSRQGRTLRTRGLHGTPRVAVEVTGLLDVLGVE